MDYIKHKKIGAAVVTYGILSNYKMLFRIGKYTGLRISVFGIYIQLVIRINDWYKYSFNQTK